MKLIIKNPAPNDHRMKKWGDYHFGRSLSKYLTRSGIEVVTHYKSQWGKIEKGDAVLVLRGKYPYHPD
nr:glycosyltransferase family 1 protein [Spirochaetota bacterium]